MKNLILVVTLAFSINSIAQSTPEPPEPPQTSNNHKVSTNTSIHIDKDISHSSSVSVTKSDKLYKFKASFKKSITEEIKKLIIDKLGKENQVLKNNTYLWNRILNNEEVFTCKLKKGNVRIYIEKDGVSSSLYRKVEALGEELKYVISDSGHRKSARKDAEHAKRDLERAKKDLERAKKEVERSKTKN